ncbi:hypothetical protein [Cellulomonas edaphi]|uniref:Uncharacterized protein n=1 Tax=Cellulomonas edaphi TaxID=3053468 RepID=A0ABT7S3B1_9CELL|nr:hypothetical protein [Cellulomons edaphi]MDM7830114.1 hypothetical protein [Cellulomons edaphi]
MSTASVNRQRRVAAAKRRAEQESAAQRARQFGIQYAEQMERQRDAQARRRRRTALLILAGSLVLALVVAAAAARIASGYSGTELRYMIGIAGKYSHKTIYRYVATEDVWRFARAVQLVPAALAEISVLLMWIRPPRGFISYAALPSWIGAAIAPGLAISVLLGFAADAAGDGRDDFRPAMAAVAPEGLPIVGFFAVVVVWAFVDKHRRESRRTRVR